MNETDEALMRAYQAGDQTAMNQLFEHNKVRILNFCIGLLGSRADAEEIAADAFVALIKHKDSYQPNRTFSTWFFTIARNLCLNRIRERRKSVTVWFATKTGESRDSWDIADEREHSRERLEKKERGHAVRQAIAALQLEQREAIVLKQFHGFSYEEISLILNCSLEKVKILIFRAKINLKSQLASFIGEALL